MTSWKQKKIGVLLGGMSREREISLRTGHAVANALKSLGYQVQELDVDRGIAQRVHESQIEVAFLCLHGRYGEDGAIQGMLEVMGIPYTGSGVLASAMAMDKNLTKKMAASVGVRVPDWQVIRRDVGANLVFAPGRSQSPLPLPVIVKPNREGSTIGMAIVRKAEEFAPAVTAGLGFDESVLVESFITGREVTVAMLEQADAVGVGAGAYGNTPLQLPILEVIPKGGFYDFSSKYTKGMTEYQVPAKIAAPVAEEIGQASQKVWQALNLRGVARADFMIDAQGKSYFLEVNTIPGMTETSLVPKAAAAVGISFEALCERILTSVSL